VSHSFAAAAVKDSPEYRIFRIYKTKRDKANLSGPDPEACEISQAFASTSAAKYLFSSFKAFNDKLSDSGFPHPHNITNLAIDEARSIRGQATSISLVVNICPGIPTNKDVRALAGPVDSIARIFSFGTEAAPRGKALYQTADSDKSEKLMEKSGQNVHSAAELTPTHSGRSSFDGDGIHATWFRRPNALATHKKYKQANEVRLRKEYPTAPGKTGHDKHLYFGLGPDEAPRSTAVNDVFAAKTTYEETTKYLKGIKPMLDSIGLRCQEENWRQTTPDVESVAA